jgi:HD superfamily phosphohydrolase YqeK
MADHHELTITFEDPEIVPEALVEKYYDDWATPMHVRSHCKAVKDLCLQMGQAYIESSVLINLDLLNTAALLHDMARICDFTELDRNKFHEEITDEKWSKWIDLRNRFQGLHHADIANKALRDEGYLKTAEVIRLHNSLSILEEPEKLEDFEAAILFYADKRVKHDEVVSLTERFEDGRIRHGKYDDPKTRSKFEEVEKKTFELEKRLFIPINLKPDSLTS